MGYDSCMEMKEILARIDSCKAHFGISDRQLSLSAGLSAEGIRNWRRRVANGDNPGANMRSLEAVAQVLGVSPEWLARGEGTPDIVMATGDGQATPLEVKRAAPTPPLMHGQRFIRTIDMTAQGTGTPEITTAPPLFDFAMPPEVLRSITRAKNEELAFVRIRGEAMAPSIGDGDFALIDTTQRNYDIDGCYLIAAGEALQIRRISRDPRTALYRIRADNERYEAWETDGLTFYVYGRVIWLCKRL